MDRLILADSSVWIAHFRSASAVLDQLLDDDQLRMHDYVRGEIAMGNLTQREQTLRMLARIDATPTAAHAEVAELIERQRLHGLGIGYVDASLIASCRLTPSLQLWTLDRRLSAAAERCAVAVAYPVH